MENPLELKDSLKSRSILKNKNFMILFTGKLVSQLGDAIYNIAIGWYILAITKSAMAMSIYIAVGTIVYVFMGPLGGVIADRLDRKKLMVWMDIIRGVVVAFIGLLMYVHIQSIWIFCIASAILSLCGAIFVPASNALIPNIVENSQLTKANSMGASVQSISSIVGLIAGAILYATIGIKKILFLNAISYILSGIVEMFIVLNKTENSLLKASAKKHFIKELIETYNFIKTKKGLYIIMWIYTLINFITVPLLAVFLPYIFNVIIKNSIIQYSYIGASTAIGFLIGAAILSLMPEKDKISIYIRGSMIAFCTLVLSMYIVFKGYESGFILTSGFVIFFAIISFFIGISNSIINIPIMVLMQKSVPDEMLGKASGLVNTFVMCAIPLGIIVGGIVTDLLPMKILLFCTSLFLTLITIYLCLQKDISKI
jgi:DHA3 family macrolide efflux protein-like MFS transporter